MLPSLAQLPLATGGAYGRIVSEHPVLQAYLAREITYEEAMRRLGADEPRPEPGNDKRAREFYLRGQVIARVDRERRRRAAATAER